MVAWVVWQSRAALFPFMIGLVIAYVVLPLVNRIENLIPDRGVLHHVRRTFAVLLVYIIGLAILIGGFVSIGPRAYQETLDLSESIPSYVETIREESDYWSRRYEEDVPPDIREQIESNLDQVSSAVTEDRKSVV